MRYLLSLFFLLLIYLPQLPGQGYGHSNSTRGQWERLVGSGNITDLAADSESAWLLIDKYLVHVDFATHTTEVGISVKNEDAYPFGLNDISLAADGRLYALTRFNKFYYSTAEKWESATIPSEPGVSTSEKIIYRDGDGAYLFLDTDDQLVRWLPFTAPRVVDELMEQLSFPIREVAWQASTSRLWVTGSYRGGYFENDEYTPLPLPTLWSTILEIKPDLAGGAWLRTIDEVFYFDGERLFRYELPDSMADFNEIEFAVLESGTALLATADTKLMVGWAEEELQVTDYSEELASWAADQPFVGDGKGNAWLFDVDRRRVGRWEPGQLHWERVDQWLPAGTQTTFITQDADQRVWIGGARGLHAFAENRWQAGERFYPGMPAAGKAVYFTSDQRPIVAVDGGSAKGLYAYRSPNDWVRLTDTVYNDVVYERTVIDRYDNLRMFREIVPEYLLWDEGEFISIRTNSFFPVPTALYDIYIAESGAQFIVTELGVFKRYGSVYELIPLPENEFSEGFSPVWRRARFSPSGILWIADQNRLYKWDLPADERPLDLVETFEGTGDIRKFHTVKDEVVLFQASQNVIYRYDSKGVRWYSDAITFDDWGFSYHPPYAQNALEDDQGRIWLLSGGTVWLFTPGSKPALALHETEELPGFSVAPNPARDMMLVHWQNEVPQAVTLQLFNAGGQVVREQYYPNQDAGDQAVTFRRNGLPGGVYFLVIEGAQRREVKKVVWK